MRVVFRRKAVSIYVTASVLSGLFILGGVALLKVQSNHRQADAVAVSMEQARACVKSAMEQLLKIDPPTDGSHTTSCYNAMTVSGTIAGPEQVPVRRYHYSVQIPNYENLKFTLEADMQQDVSDSLLCSIFGYREVEFLSNFYPGNSFANTSRWPVCTNGYFTSDSADAVRGILNSHDGILRRPVTREDQVYVTIPLKYVAEYRDRRRNLWDDEDEDQDIESEEILAGVIKLSDQWIDFPDTESLKGNTLISLNDHLPALEPSHHYSLVISGDTKKHYFTNLILSKHFLFNARGKPVILRNVRVQGSLTIKNLPFDTEDDYSLVVDSWCQFSNESNSSNDRRPNLLVRASSDPNGRQSTTVQLGLNHEADMDGIEDPDNMMQCDDVCSNSNVAPSPSRFSFHGFVLVDQSDSTRIILDGEDDDGAAIEFAGTAIAAVVELGKVKLVFDDDHILNTTNMPGLISDRYRLVANSWKESMSKEGDKLPGPPSDEGELVDMEGEIGQGGGNINMGER